TSISDRGSCRQNFIDMNPDGYPGLSVPSSGTSSIASNWCRFEMCAVSRSPSMDCTQLQKTCSLFTVTSEDGSASGPKSLKGVIASGGPMYVQTMPPDSWAG